MITTRVYRQNEEPINILKYAHEKVPLPQVELLTKKLLIGILTYIPRACCLGIFG